MSQPVCLPDYVHDVVSYVDPTRTVKPSFKTNRTVPGFSANLYEELAATAGSTFWTNYYVRRTN